MMRKILGAVVGYVVFFLSLYLLFTGFSVALGADRIFLPGNYDPSMTWIIGAFVLGCISATIGGYVAALIGKRGAVKIMAGIVVLIGAIVFVQLFSADRPVKPRTVALPTMEAMFEAREPLWVAAVNPFLVATAVFAGGALRRKHENAPASSAFAK